MSRECPFCQAVFSRVDGARRHAKRCPRRGIRPLPAAKRGRRTVSCDRCSRHKVHCNAWVQTPCERCTSRQLACTFARCSIESVHDSLRQDPPLPIRSDHAGDNQIGYDQDGTHQNGEDQSVVPHNGHLVPLSFLLNATDDKQDFVTEQAVSTEPNGALLGPICVTPSQARQTRARSKEIPDYINPILLLPSNFQADLAPLQLAGLHNADEDNSLNALLSSCSHGDRLAARIELLESHFETQIRSNHRYLAQYDAAAFRRFFSVSNVYAFATMFCRKRHYQYPLIHWPTFALEEATLPLLMVVALTGAAYSYHSGNKPEHVTNARNFYPLADMYIFDQLDAFFGGSVSSSCGSEAIQLCQAALLMYGLNTLVARDAAMQQMASTQRLSALISALRRLEFTGCRHNPSEDWQLFLQQEQIVRLVSWTFCADCLATLSYNHPPISSVLEMTGDLPCDPVLWDIDSESDFNRVTCLRRQPSHSLRDLMSSFLDDESQLDIARENIPVFHLQIIMCGFQQTIFNLHVTMTLPKQSDKLLKTLSTWRCCWERAMDEIPSNYRNWLGVARNVPSIEFLSRRVIEVAVDPEASPSRYLQRTPSYGRKELHEFIREFVFES